jgi:hypothetical protein
MEIEIMKKLPIGIDSFPEIIEGGFIYADKTELLLKLADSAGQYFLSRPPGFGKTLSISTLEAILRGRRELFKGLWIDGADRDWTPTPVIRLNLNDIPSESVESVEAGLTAALKAIADSEGLKLDNDFPSFQFDRLISRMLRKHGRDAAVLIDDYAAPVLANLGRPSLALKIWDALLDFYVILKSSHGGLRSVFITGVGQIALMTIFSSALNNLAGLTTHYRYAAICGFTGEEFGALFADHVEAMLEELLSQALMPPGSSPADLRGLFDQWYGGYCWDCRTRIYNPWSVLSALENRRFDRYWAKSVGTTTLVAEVIKSQKVDLNLVKLHNKYSHKHNFIEIQEKLNRSALMFHAGFLKLGRLSEPGDVNEYFDFPNFEVKSALLPLLLGLEPMGDLERIRKLCVDMMARLADFDADGFRRSFEAVLELWPGQAPKPGQRGRLLLAAMHLGGAESAPGGVLGNEGLDGIYRAPDWVWPRNSEPFLGHFFCPFGQLK